MPAPLGPLTTTGRTAESELGEATTAAAVAAAVVVSWLLLLLEYASMAAVLAKPRSGPSKRLEKWVDIKMAEETRLVAGGGGDPLVVATSSERKGLLPKRAAERTHCCINMNVDVTAETYGRKVVVT